MDGNLFLTITGLNHYYDKKPFEIDRIVKLTKEPQNSFDKEAIRVELPYIGTVGYVANSVNTVNIGTYSAGRLYEHIGESAFAQVMFITHSSVIAVVLPPESDEEVTEHAETEKTEVQSTSNPKEHNPASPKQKWKIGFTG
jgi:hypothetical protein